MLQRIASQVNALRADFFRFCQLSRHCGQKKVLSWWRWVTLPR